jgi:hypothetical protein
MAALTDFSDRRCEIFANLDRRQFKVHTVDPTSAEVTEGASFLGIWERIRYDWSEPGVVRLTSLESNTFASGSDWVYRLDEDGNGGTRVDLTVTRVPGSLQGHDLAKALRAVEAAPS